MIEETFEYSAGSGTHQIPLTKVHTLILGSGAAGLNAAAQLKQNGVSDLLILTEGLSMGTSINTGSDKQTYYKLSLAGADADSPRAMAETYFANGSMHGDLALIESSLSVRSFINLVNLGVPFPRDEYGQFVGYKTDHDPRQRATSIGPYTSREMCVKLIAQIKAMEIPVREQRNVIELITLGGDDKRIAGCIALDRDGNFEAYLCENLIFAVGGPGGLYETSVYPPVHTGAIGLALKAGAKAANLTESQYGLASTKFRWNVSGTYMQVIPRVISRAADGISEEREFLPPYFHTASEMNGMVFLKGYQWPFDARKAVGGSSIIDILVYIETMAKGRRVYLDFRTNPDGFSLAELPAEARDYLERSKATQPTPIDRLWFMNPGAVELYSEHGIDLRKVALEVAVCAQHNNGGLAGNIWYESTNIKHLFPVGEVNGSHGVTRPGGSALNAGQVAGFRAAEYIANRYNRWTMDEDAARVNLSQTLSALDRWTAECFAAKTPWLEEMKEVQKRMSRAGAHIRDKERIKGEVPQAWQQVKRLDEKACSVHDRHALKYAFRLRQLAYASAVYLDAIQFALESGVGSRGSQIVLDAEGGQVHELLDASWKIQPEDTAYRSKVLESQPEGNSVSHQWVNCRSIPESDTWFETTWARFRKGEIYD